ncbi:YlxM family DNA-binding protein [Anaerosphaera multitolerans]|nr:sigma factor-like helix-turn-helix DNA-binding protein [Anaerosphaera multitolerans]
MTLEYGDDMIENVIKMNMLLDFYGKLLSEKQLKAMEMYYKYDYSLNEIAEELNISKQAVSNNLKRAEINLNEFENKLGLIELNRENKKKSEDLKNLFKSLKSNSKELDDITLRKIYSIIFNEEEVYYDI